MKKRYLALGVLALELATASATFPAAAQIIDRVSLSVSQKAISHQLDSKAGHAKFVVSSNAPFTIVTKDTIGDFDVSIHKSGVINGNPFGENAQMPGAANACATALSTAPTNIYMATQKTAAQKGGILTQAVVVEIRYAPETRPSFKIVTQDKSRDFAQAATCADVST